MVQTKTEPIKKTGTVIKLFITVEVEKPLGGFRGLVRELPMTQLDNETHNGARHLFEPKKQPCSLFCTILEFI